MSNPSRHDYSRLLSGNGGVMFDNYCLRPELNSMQCDVRLKDETAPFINDTKCILLLGEEAMHKYLPETLGNTLNEMRGSLFHIKGIPTICSYLPQNAVDIYKDYEKEQNPMAADYNPDTSISEDGEEDEGDVKKLGKTKRSNYAFWLKADCTKAKVLCGLSSSNGSSIATILGSLLRNNIQPKYHVFPGSEELVNILTTNKNRTLLLDLETDYEEQNLQCFAFSFDGINIYSVPILDYNYHPACSDYCLIMRALAIAVRDNVTVCHNGACFDFLVLAHKYHIPVMHPHDTLIAMHRCYPDVEKSLGHCTSLWTWEKFHKDEDSQGYRTHDQMMQRLRYCGKDVYTMGLIKAGIDVYAKTIPGLEKSISDAMRCINPYLISTLMGIKVNQSMIDNMCKENDRLMVQYNRLIEWFIGEQGMAIIRGGKKLGMFAGSNKQCCKYFHELLGYAVIAKGKPNQFGQQSPSLGKKALYRLALKHENPVINLICAYRQVKKETSRLRFLPWKPGRDSTQWVIGNVKTFRLGSRAIFKTKRVIPLTGEIKERGFGGNIQNIEKSMREIYIPDGLNILSS
jgi:hypothetical protein